MGQSALKGHEQPESDKRYLANLASDESLLAEPKPESMVSPLSQTESLSSDAAMLKKADVWLSQFKTRLNLGIIVMVVLWGSISFYKSSGAHPDAKGDPDAEVFTADGSIAADESMQPAPADPATGLNRLAPEAAPAEDAAASNTEKATAPRPAKSAKAVKPAKAGKKASAKARKKAGNDKAQARQQKKLKKSLAAKQP